MIAFVTSERFSLLDEKDRDRLESLAKLDQFADGQELPAPGEWLSLVVQGGVELRARGLVLGLLGPGDLLGEIEAFADLHGEISYVARGETIVRAISKNPLLQELKIHRSLASGLLAVYCRSISEKVRLANDAAIARSAGMSRPPPSAAARAPHLSEDELAWIRVLGSPIEASAGEMLIREGETSRGFYVVEQGSLEVLKHAPDGDRTLAHLGPRDLFGIMAFVDRKPRSASVIARGPVALVRVEASALEKATQVNFTTSFKFLGTLCNVLGRTFRDTILSVT